MRTDWPLWLRRVRQVWDALPTREGLMVAAGLVVCGIAWRTQNGWMAFAVFIVALGGYMGSQVTEVTLPGGVSFKFALGSPPEDQNSK